MPASFLHGVETIEIQKGARTIKTVKTAVVGLVGTAPIESVAEEYRTINEPTLILNEIDAVKYFGTAPFTDRSFTVPQTASLPILPPGKNTSACRPRHIFRESHPK